MNIAIILAGGMGKKMGIADIPKQFIDVYGKPLLVHTLESFEFHQDIDSIAVVCQDEWKEDVMIWIRKYDLNKVKWIVSSGETRQKSAYNGLTEIADYAGDEDIVIIHDASRPLVTHRIISDNIKMAKLYEAVDTVIPSEDTIIISQDEKVISEVPLKKCVYIGQTPQSFKYKVITKAHKDAEFKEIVNATDDCQLILGQGKNVYLVKGDKLNLKISTFEDIVLLKAIIKMGKIEVN